MNKLNFKEFSEKFGSSKDAVVINVLDEEMYRNEHIPGSINIPLQSLDFLEQVTGAVPDQKTPLVVYSGSQDCPAWEGAARQLEEAGYSQVFAYSGGIEDWKEAGRDIESDIPPMTPKEEAARTGGEVIR